MNTTDTATTRFIVVTRTPALSGKAREFGAGYRKIALVEIDPAALPPGRTEPAMISPRSRGVVKVHRCASLYYGKGLISEGAAFLRECEEEANRRNSQP